VKIKLKEDVFKRSQKYADSELMVLSKLKIGLKASHNRKISDAFRTNQYFFNDSPILDELLSKIQMFLVTKNT